MALVLDGTNGVSGVDGTASNPSLEGTDSNTGVFFPAADTVAIGTGGTEALRVNSSQNVGIGTTSPTNKLHVLSTSSEVARFIRDNTSNASGGITIGNNSRVFTIYGDNSALSFWDTTASAQRMTLDASGNLGLGTTSTSTYRANISRTGGGGLQVSTTASTASNPSIDLLDGAVDAVLSASGTESMFWVGTYSNHPVGFRTNNSERARFTAAGGFTCAGIYNTTVGATNRDVFVDNGGVVGYVSSLRASKTNIANLTDTSWLYQLNPVTFNYRKKDEEGNYTDEVDGDIQYGMIAEDVEQVRPDLCFYDEVEGQQELRGIQYSKLVPVMLKALQELKAELDATKAEVALLKGAA